ncbi:NAD(P)-dependent alcohol dehydrogenase [Aspergillus fischeri NRRL 181]|uniref:Alcohol dehydrogenase, putative n=1 Tax=Neosartorya fischeri (strain ATCC 1020 / DSM 3700 / CBS 544.65 / FGSC A1164 / JCM 1740 / NRRL 181 / WB 181) TaxID=331117 RepID=A1DJM6_NEOFI|nr:Alcohol dehydrogenase, putative [Aspergillus fischeri NRRL 181]EAW16915.1 Alcohol dehydrogenase, putative [Aspergillus fischeri NRRL 181]
MIPDKQIPTTGFVVEKPGAPLTLQNIILDEVRANEVLIEMKYTGLCHTDIVVQQGDIPVGDYPAVLGHEGAGIVRRVGSGVKNKSLRAADSPISFPGGKGPPIRGQFFGQFSMSRLAIVSEHSVIKCSPGSEITVADMAVLAPLGCGYLTGAGTVLNVLKPKPKSTFVVLGMGAVGMAAMLAARSQGVETIIAVDMLDVKLELAKSLGASHALSTKIITDLAQGLLDIFPGGVDYVLDTTGVDFLFESAVKALGHEGILAIVGVARAGSLLKIDPLALMMGCKQIVGVIEGGANPASLLPVLVDLYKHGKFPVDKLAKVYAPDSLDQAIEDLRSGRLRTIPSEFPESYADISVEQVIKPVIKWEDV